MSIFTNLTSATSKIAALWSTIAAVFPLVETFVQQVESAFPAGTAGATKLAQVQSFLQAAWGTASGIEVAFADAWPSLQGLITALVSLYNITGLFQHGAPTAAAAKGV